MERREDDWTGAERRQKEEDERHARAENTAVEKATKRNVGMSCGI